MPRIIRAVAKVAALHKLGWLSAAGGVVAWLWWQARGKGDPGVSFSLSLGDTYGFLPGSPTLIAYQYFLANGNLPKGWTWNSDTVVNPPDSPGGTFDAGSLPILTG